MNSYSKQVIDMSNSAGMTVDESNEHQRRWTEKGKIAAAKHGNYDLTRMHLNFEIAPGGIVQPIDTSKSIPRRMKENLAARGIEDPNVRKKKEGKVPNRRTIAKFVFGGSRERMNQLAFGDQVVDLEPGADNSHLQRMPEIEQWALDVYRWVCDKWGEQNIIGFYVHLDEKNAHIHCSLLPINERNKFEFKGIFCGKNKVEMKERNRQLHTEFYEAVGRKWGLQRGEDINTTGAKHRTSEEYRRELRADCDHLEIEKARSRREYDEQQTELAKCQKRVKGLTTMIANLEDKKTELEAQLCDIEDALKAGGKTVAAASKEIDEVRAELNQVNAALADKQAKLDVAIRQLDDVQNEIDAQRQVSHLLKSKNVQMAEDLQQNHTPYLAFAAYGCSLPTISKVLAILTPEQRQRLDPNMLGFIDDLSSNGSKIFEIANLLCLGQLDTARTVAQNSGGAGGSPSDDNWWKRKPEEDENRYRWRMVFSAHLMLKPATTRRSIRRN